MQIDCYGFDATSQYFRRKELEAYLVRRVGGVLYVCFGEGAMRPVHRIDRDGGGCVRVMWAYGRWEDAETLSYVPINETLEIREREE